MNRCHGFGLVLEGCPMSFSEEHYRLNFFLENGYVRKRCPVCGEFYWTMNKEQELCGESPCVPYSFIDKMLTGRRFSLDEVRAKFLGFFESRGHQVIRPYPVVSRWRDDMFLTDASIVDFQPLVTSGLAPPPANPLVISQPCIRLTDIDKVGYTFGRHLTSFEMGGAHAFNFPGEEIYWKERTVDLHQEFITQTLNVRPELVFYKESVWSGGGNAGPCLEGVVGGLEVCTLVFMQYKTRNGDLIELPVRTVDTGYGMERYTWLSQGTPSCFDAVYGPMYPTLAKAMKVPDVDPEILGRYAPYTSLLAPGEKTMAELRKDISQASGVPIEIIDREMRYLERFYAALDFTKSISLIIAEGVIPSNTGAGYLSRLLIRRTYRLLSDLRQEENLSELIEAQVDYWGNVFLNLREMKDEILDIVAEETKKFRETLERGRDFVNREIAKLDRSKETSLDFMIKAYDERGLTPDLVSQVANEQGLRMAVPENFYELVASRHLKAEIEKPAEAIELEQRVSGLPATEKLYYKDKFMERFTAKVLRVFDSNVVLDRTTFYPEGGGQAADTGTIKGPSGISTVAYVQIVDGVIVHQVEGPPPSVGDDVVGELDAKRRFGLMRHHTATHILIGAASRVLGKHAWQAGARKEYGRARLDISHHRRLTPDEVIRLERTANDVVARRMPVHVAEMNRNDAEKKHGFRLYQGGEVPSKDVRVVEIPGWDAEACGGIHVDNTEDVGFIKIVRNERIQDGVERLIFSAGPAAIDAVEETEGLLSATAAELGVPPTETPKKASDLVEVLKQERKTSERLFRILAKVRARELASSSADIRGLKVVSSFEELDDQGYLVELAAQSTQGGQPSTAVVMAGKETIKLVVICNDAAMNAGLDAGKLARAIAEKTGGKAGGKPDLAQGGFPYSPRVEEALKEVGKIVDRQWKPSARSYPGR